MCVTYLSKQGGDNVQWCLMDGFVLQGWSEGHVHQGPDLLQNHIPAAWVIQNLAVLVDLFLHMNQITQITHLHFTNATKSYENGARFTAIMQQWLYTTV